MAEMEARFVSMFQAPTRKFTHLFRKKAMPQTFVFLTVFQEYENETVSL